jgi:hypothetical protein
MDIDEYLYPILACYFILLREESDIGAESFNGNLFISHGRKAEGARGGRILSYSYSCSSLEVA